MQAGLLEQLLAVGVDPAPGVGEVDVVARAFDDRGEGLACEVVGVDGGGLHGVRILLRDWPGRVSSPR